MPNIFITGGTGTIGRALREFWQTQGHTVWILSRSQKGEGIVTGDPCVSGDWLTKMLECDIVVHLAGESIAKKRWSKSQKELIYKSRVESTSLIAKTLAEKPSQVKVWLSASGVGYYGNFAENRTEFVEGDLPSSDFLSKVAYDWEKATVPAKESGIRVVNTRIGIVLDTHEGFLPTVAKPFRYYFGGVIGKGQQWISWIHIQDLVRLFDWCIQNTDISGPVNITAPQPVTHWGFCKTLAKHLKKPCSFYIPAKLIEWVMGEKGELATKGVRAVPQKAHEGGFDFKYPTLREALEELLK